MIHLVDVDAALTDCLNRTGEIINRDREVGSPDRPVVLDQMNLLPASVEPCSGDWSGIGSRDLDHAEYVPIEGGCLGRVRHLIATC